MGREDRREGERERKFRQFLLKKKENYMCRAFFLCVSKMSIKLNINLRIFPLDVFLSNSQSNNGENLD